METLRKQLVILHTFTSLLSGWGVGLFLKGFFSDYYFSWYPFIPVFFYVIGLITIYIITPKKKRSELKTANLYLLIKIIKSGASILVVSLIFFLINDDRKTFALVFCGFYVLYLGLETYFFYRAEKILNKFS